MDARLSSLEGRIGRIEERLDSLRKEFIDRLDNRFLWLLGVQLSMWITLIGAILFKR